MPCRAPPSDRRPWPGAHPGPCAIAAPVINSAPIANPTRTTIEPFIPFPLSPIQ